LSALLSVESALAQILSPFTPLPAETIDLTAALGRVLAEDVQSGIDLPPFANSSMDGYAVRAADVAQATHANPVPLRPVLDIPAGAAPNQTIEPGETARIMTGAPMPPGADAVIPVEDTDSNWRAGTDEELPEVVQFFRSVQTGDYVRPAGENVQRGQTVLRAGTVIRPQDIGILAALGLATIRVVRPPRVVIVSTGDELVDVGEPLAPGKIRDTNSYTLAALITSYGGIPIRLPIARDTLEDVRALFRAALDEEPDIIISSAGVSVGTYDVVRTVLEELGQIDFWRVNVRPGKPLAYGQLGGAPFFGLPGNPVSAMITFEVFVRPALLKLLHRSDDSQIASAITAEDIHSDGRRSYLRVTLTREDGQLKAHTTGTQSSGALLSMVLADALLIVPEDVTFVPAGSRLPVRLLRPV
jgi:molybdopterin molybdotransferase